MPNEQRPPDRLVIDVTIKGGDVTPTNAQLETKVKNPIVVRVDSDAADQLHVHDQHRVARWLDRRDRDSDRRLADC